MFEKIELWFRNIMRSEVQIARDDIQGFVTHFDEDVEDIEARFEADLKKFEEAFDRAMAGLESRVTERLEQMVAEVSQRFDAKAQLIEQAISKELDHWKIDEEARKADDALRHPKQPKKR
jgi:archaellum component FlaC